MDLSKPGSAEHIIFTEKVNSIRNTFTAEGSKELVMHVGGLEQEQVNAISNIVETQMGNYGISKGVVKKIFNISIETLQNICFHGEKDANGNKMTYFIIGKSGTDFSVHSGNIITNETAETLATRLQRIKSLSDADLKKEYLDVLSNGELSKKGGAGLGFITIALKSNNNIEFEFLKLNDKYSLFSIKAIVTG